MRKTEMPEFINSLCIKYAELNPLPKNTTEWLQAYRLISDQLPTQVETHKTKTVKVMKKVIVDGNEIEIPVDKRVPVIVDFDPSSQQTFLKIAELLEKAYVEKPIPQLEFKDRTDLKSFLEALKFMFPNVQDVKQTTASVMKWRMSFDNKFS